MKKLIILTLFVAFPALGQRTVTSLYPASGPASGGTLVHITGTGLSAPIVLCPTCSPKIRFGDALGTILIETDTEIVVQSPPQAAGTVDVTVDIGGPPILTVPAAFRYDDPPASDVEKVLLPIALGSPVSGALGSIWSSDINIFNASSQDVTILAPTCNPVLLAPCPPNLNMASGSTASPTIYGTPGAFVKIPRRNLDDIDIVLRIQDVSRQAQTWGTAIPVAKATDFRKLIRLSGVPKQSRFRNTLRVYGYSGMPDAVTIRIFDPTLSQPLSERTFALQQSGNPEMFPSYLQIDPLDQLSLPDRVRIEIASSNPIWAFISITNNETQHVTVIAPQ